MKEFEYELSVDDYKWALLQNYLVRGSKLLRAFKCLDSRKFEIHYVDASGNLCKSRLTPRRYTRT